MDKLELLKKRLKELKKVAIAYSGGVDSNFLMSVARETLGKENVLAVLCSGAMLAQVDYQEAVQLLKDKDVQYEILAMDVFTVPEFAGNDKKRCYYCKKNLMSKIIEMAKTQGYEVVLDGKNLDDAKVYRPGAAAAQELGICSLLYECGFTKQDIRNVSRELGIITWNKPSNACLASRFPYGTQLTAEKLKQVEDAERCLKELGIDSGRIRVHDRIARVEVAKEDFKCLLEHKDFVNKVKACGFDYVTLDLEGFRSGSFDL
ncbi:ATP-dependent sacrificial sulfur transferase LarE [Robinsoniella peoriensis]|uniref:ATP-dependent sacrificial sulfur transferase LarE n=1 Tax=Robinsoniella peoriensis TaxID=180332 RepID=UPI0036337954